MWGPVLAVGLALMAGFWLLSLERVNIPAHMSNHPVKVIKELIPRPIAADLMNLMKEFGAKGGFTSNVDQSKAQGFKPRYEDIGEAEPIGIDGKCKHKFLFPNSEKTKCILPQRVDIGRHFILTGGIDGIKEGYSDLVDRVSSFGRYTFPEQLDDYPAVKALFASPSFQKAARSVCPKDKQHLDAFQFNYIINVPGQTVALHIDSVYFQGADRFSHPQWLLAAMAFSGVFQSLFVHQVQVVGYLHEWSASANSVESVGGEFIWFDNSTSFQRVSPEPRSGSVVDGSKVMHASTVYRPDVKAPHLDKSKDNVLRYLPKNDSWVVQSDGETVQTLSTSDLRISVVYRARCFRDAEHMDAYKEAASKQTSVLSLDSVLDALVAELVKRGKLPQGTTKDSMGRLELAFKLMDGFITYPLPPVNLAFIPFNLCAAPLVLPVLGPLFAPFC